MEEWWSGGRATIIATAIWWGMDLTWTMAPVPHPPWLIHLLRSARDYGLPPLLPGQTELQWAMTVRDALRSERMARI